MTDQSSLSNRAEDIANTVTHVLRGRISTWQAIRDLILPELRKVRQEALAEARERPSIPDGWRVVPKKPTEEWLSRVASKAHGGEGGARMYIQIVLAAAPEPSE